MEQLVHSSNQKYLQYDRVRRHTASYVNDRIDLITRARVEQMKNQGRDAVIRRIAELDHEWDIDRALMLNFAILGGATFTAGVLSKKGWLYLFATQMVFLGLHSVSGWCPPVVAFRRMNFRTRNEIDAEKHELLRWLEEADSGRFGEKAA